MRKILLSALPLICTAILFSCASSKRTTGKNKNGIFENAAGSILDAPELKGAHIGIAIYDPGTKKYLYDHNGDKYFIPASNTKIITCYAAMKHFNDSLIGMRYRIEGDTVSIIATGDPTFLHPDFSTQPVLDFINQFDSNKQITIDASHFQDEPWGSGWSWDDYFYSYMPERSAIPVYGNIVSFEGSQRQWTLHPPVRGKFIDTKSDDTMVNFVRRELNANNFRVGFNSSTVKKISVPFVTDSSLTNIAILQQMVKPRIILQNQPGAFDNGQNYKEIHSQPTDSLLKIMMHRSDNFFAEQSLLMVSDKMLGLMNDEKIIDTLLKTDLPEMPQPPQWVDGSGLSRYNLFTPQDFVFVLEKMRNEFGWDRIATIFPTAGTGTLEGLYKGYENSIYAKTGTLSNNIALSGYIITRSNKTLIFSILVGNHMAQSKSVRKGMEQFITEIISRY